MANFIRDRVRARGIFFGVLALTGAVSIGGTRPAGMTSTCTMFKPLSPKTPMAIVDLHTSAGIVPIPVPRYNPKVAYNPCDPNTSPLFAPPAPGDHPYLRDRPYYVEYDGAWYNEIANFPPEPTGIYGYGPAINVVPEITGGNAPAVLMSTSTEPKPPDLAAIAAVNSSTAAAAAAESGAFPVLANMAIRLRRRAPATEPSSNPASTTTPTLSPSTAGVEDTAGENDPLLTRLGAAFALEDARHARGALPIPKPPTR